MTSKELKITFGEHISQDEITSMVSGIAAYGNVTATSSSRTFIVEIYRLSKLPGLQKTLHELEMYGFLRWQESD